MSRDFEGDKDTTGNAASLSDERRTFTVYRRGDLSATHNADQVLPSDEAQFEGVVFSDGHCVVRWLTLSHSTAVWPSFDEMWRIHGHDAPGQPHGTVLVWDTTCDRCATAEAEVERLQKDLDTERDWAAAETMRVAEQDAIIRDVSAEVQRLLKRTRPRA